MSYEIIYDKQFIKAKKDGQDVFIPMLYWGSNNCYDVLDNGRQRRERNWSPISFILDGKRYGTLESMLEKAAKHRAEKIERYLNQKDYKEEGFTAEDYDKRFSWYEAINLRGSRMTYAQYLGLFKTGCKKAMTVEQLKNYGVDVRVYSYAYDEEKMKAKGLEPFRITVQTSDELIRVIDEKQAEFNPKGYDIYVTLDIWNSEETLKTIRRQEFPVARKGSQREQILVKEFWNLTNEHGAFLKNTRRGYRYSYNNDGGKKFATEKEATVFKNKMSGGDKWTVTHHQKEAYVYVPKIKIQKVEAL